MRDEQGGERIERDRRFWDLVTRDMMETCERLTDEGKHDRALAYAIAVREREKERP